MNDTNFPTPTCDLVFPTPIYKWTLPDFRPLNAELRSEIYRLRDSDPKGVERSNIAALGGWHSAGSLHAQPAFLNLGRAVAAATAQISADQHYHPNVRLAVDTMWAIISPPGSLNKAHIHPHSLWSGVYYVQTPPDCGGIEFTDPRTAKVMSEPQMTCSDGPAVSPPLIPYGVSAGLLLVFPSWLTHAVSPNLSILQGPMADRIVISFNISASRGPAAP